MRPLLNQIIEADCLDAIRALPARSVDLVLWAPPYQITAATWDGRLPWRELWAEIERVLTEDGCAAINAVSRARLREAWETLPVEQRATIARVGLIAEWEAEAARRLETGDGEATRQKWPRRARSRRDCDDGRRPRHIAGVRRPARLSRAPGPDPAAEVSGRLGGIRGAAQGRPGEADLRATADGRRGARMVRRAGKRGAGRRRSG